MNFTESFQNTKTDQTPQTPQVNWADSEWFKEWLLLARNKLKEE